MKTIKEKRAYHSPTMEHIKLDNEISLILQSAEDPDGDPWAEVQNGQNNDPFKTNLA